MVLSVQELKNIYLMIISFHATFNMSKVSQVQELGTCTVTRMHAAVCLKADSLFPLYFLVILDGLENSEL